MQGKKPVVSSEQFNSTPLVKWCAPINLKSIVFQEKCPSFSSLPQAIFCHIGESINFYKTLPLPPPIHYYGSS